MTLKVNWTDDKKSRIIRLKADISEVIEWQLIDDIIVAFAEMICELKK